MNGIAIIIIMTQVKYLHTALFVVVLTIAIMLLSKKFIKFIPDSLMALVLASLLVFYFQPLFPTGTISLPLFGNASLMQNIEVIGNIPNQIPKIVLPVLSISGLLKLFLPALSIAILGSIDSLLTSVVMDNITGKKHKSNKELIGQGIGNIMAGLFGGIAGAGATVRSVVNIKCGGKTALSGAFHSIVLLSFMLILNNLVSQIPLAVLAGILIVTGFSMFDYENLKKTISTNLNADSIIMIITMVLTVVIDLMVAVGVGVCLTLIHKKVFLSEKKSHIHP